MNPSIDLQHAFQLANEADKITKQHYRSQDLVITDKPDLTPVTNADLAVEQRLSQIVTQQFHENYLGEEGTRQGLAGRLWIVDPIDGTKNFLRTMPIWATLIALTENGQVVAAVVSAPALGRRWWASKGEGAWTQDVDGTTRQLHTSKIQSLSSAFLLTATLSTWDKVPTGQARMMKLIDACWRFRAPGDFLNYMLVAEGAADIHAEADPKEWDLAAPGLIVQEAGGSLWTDATSGTPPEAPRIFVATNGHLESAVLQALNLS